MIQAEEKLEESKRLAEMSMYNVLSNDVTNPFSPGNYSDFVRFQVEQISQLRALIEAKLEFHRQTAQCLENLQQQLGHRIKEASSRPREEHVPLPVLGDQSRTPRSRYVTIMCGMIESGCVHVLVRKRRKLESRNVMMNPLLFGTTEAFHHVQRALL